MTTPENLEDRNPDEHLEPAERDVEAPEVDAYEQAIPAEAEPEDEEVRQGLEVGEYDAVEQARVVTMDDDYR